MNSRLTALGGVLGGLGAGAALMYFFDPDRGRRRRALVRDRVASAARAPLDAREAIGRLSRDVRNRSYGVVAEARNRLRRDEVSDPQLEARVRSRLGHRIEHSGWVDVRADHGVITLGGRIPAAEAASLLACVSRVRGVRDVDNHVEVQ